MYKVHTLLFTFIVTLAVSFISNSVLAKPYKSAEIYTKDTSLYGKYVFRMKSAKQSGIISNFFLWKEGSEQDNVFWEEVDIEVFGKDGATTWQSNIITGLGERIKSEKVHTAQNSLADAYHTYAIEWTPDYVAWFIDGAEVRRNIGGQVSDLSSNATMRFNFWPPNIVDWVGAFDATALPAHMFVNWVEYYRLDGTSFVLDWRDDFNTFDTTRWTKATHTFDENRSDFVAENALVSDGYLVLAITKAGDEGFSGSAPVDTGSTDPKPIEPSPTPEPTPEPTAEPTAEPTVEPARPTSTDSGGGAGGFGIFILLALFFNRRIR